MLIPKLSSSSPLLIEKRRPGSVRRESVNREKKKKGSIGMARPHPAPGCVTLTERTGGGKRGKRREKRGCMFLSCKKTPVRGSGLLLA